MNAVIDFIYRPKCGCVIGYLKPNGEGRVDTLCKSHKYISFEVIEEGKKEREKKLLTRGDSGVR